MAHPSLLKRGRWYCIQVLERAGLQYSLVDPDRIDVAAPFGNFEIYVSPGGPEYFRSRHYRTYEKPRLRTSTYFVVIMLRTTTAERVEQLLRDYMEGLKRGHESEEIALEALKLAMRKRPDLFADGFKPNSEADIGGHDLRFGLFTPTAKIFWAGFQIKSSVLAAKATLEKWRKETESGIRRECPYLRWTIVVQRDGTRESRIEQTAERMISAAEHILRRITGE